MPGRGKALKLGFFHNVKFNFKKQHSKKIYSFKAHFHPQFITYMFTTFEVKNVVSGIKFSILNPDRIRLKKIYDQNHQKWRGKIGPAST
jgi:hypothetical protein